MNRLLRITIADVLSFINLFMGFLAIISIIRGDLYIASLLMILAAAVDYADGKVARCMNSSNEFGKNIDSLVDIVSFGLVPALLCYTFLSGYLVIIPFLLILGGVYRLARYNITEQKYFTGMPITFNGIIIPIIYLSGYLTAEIAMILPVILFIMMISNIKISRFL